MKKPDGAIISSKRKIIFVLSLVCTVLTISLSVKMSEKNSLAVSTIQKDGQTQKKQINYIDEAPAASSPQEREARLEKNKRYDKKIKFKPSKKLTELPDETGSLGSRSESPRLPALPVTQSDVIAVGTITKEQPYMTDSQYLIYTEFTFQIEDVLKGKETQNILDGATITVDRKSGALRLANGKKVFYDGTNGGNSPHPNKKYLFFLQHINDGQDLSIIGGYELLNGKVFPLETTNVFSPNTGETKKIMPFAGTDESAFLQIVRDAILQDNFS